ncbi:hypothetical protein [Pandoraea sp. NPDC087047]|uniref:hypothetical protein n=1 Tax=Pandoraea sp. NPDC087047 TaxID=3364390 RepID=UPI00380049BB
MEPITFKQCFKGAWVDGFNALRNRPLLCLSVAVVILVTSALGVTFRQLAANAAQAGTSAGFRFGMSTLSLTVGLSNFFAFSVLAVHVLRYVILGPEAARQAPWMSRDVKRYMWTSVQLGLGFGLSGTALIVIAVIALRATGHANSSALISTIIVLLMCAMMFIAVRVSLIYGQIAAGRGKQWRAAWQDTRGHFWSMLGTGVATILPLVVVAILVTTVLETTLRIMPSALVAVLGILTVQAALSVVWMAVTCGVGGWLYHRYANHLLTLDAPPADD